MFKPIFHKDDIRQIHREGIEKMIRRQYQESVSLTRLGVEYLLKELIASIKIRSILLSFPKVFGTGYSPAELLGAGKEELLAQNMGYVPYFELKIIKIPLGEEGCREIDSP